MKPIKEFEDFIKEGTIKQQKPDLSRAKFLREESEKAYSFLIKLIAKFNINDENANLIIKSSYDILMETIRSKMLIEGYNSTGSHEAEISYLKKIGLKIEDIEFADGLRYSRNSSVYYGKIFEKEYAKSVFDFLKRLYPLIRT